MKILKNISDELWLGIVCLVVAAWLRVFDFGHVFISVAIVIIGMFLVTTDIVKKTEKKEIPVKKDVADKK